MSQVRSKDTKPEILVRKELYSRGIRYRIYYDLPGKPDIVITKSKKVVFIHGCFWHQHDCPKAKLPETNKDFWKDKLTKNKNRDKRNLEQLEIEGWRVFIIWECKLKAHFDSEIKKLVSWVSS